MKTQIKNLMRMMLLVILCLALTQCSTETVSGSEAPIDDNFSKITNSKSGNSKKMAFTTQLSGGNEVPAVDTDATGQAIVRISPDENSIYYKIVVVNIENTIMAHFHLGPEDGTGPPVVWLYRNLDGPSTGLIKGGILAEGHITEEDIIGSLAGDMAGLIESIRNGDIYVNVHTEVNRPGEIRGQL